ncbi:uncharacterized protein LOC131653697 [Vicia villosa]|uniref:uncharacterized protein LOC131653697 n=1 Tax=Vicia villosa TaxID=3911 RepID=UPI00273C5E56|nr:uncharacterized protein LOC131653697 [Vicia villosa]
MSQQSIPQSSSKISTSATHEQDASNTPINPSEILEVTPLQMVTPFDLVTKRPRTMHARRTKETARRPRNPNSGQTSQSSVPSSKEEPTKEGSRSNHIEIVKIVTQILNEENVSSKIPGPENPVLPKSNVIGHVSDTVDTCVPTNDEMNENVHVSDKKRNDVSVDRFEIPDGAEYNEEILNIVFTSTCVNHTEKGQTEDKEPEKTQTDKKKKAVAKCVSVGPKKAWRKVVPKKRKATSSSENESDSDVAADVNDIHLKKKVSNRKLAASVPEVPIDNISFHYPSSVLRWKFVYQKRLALERELAQNALEYDEIMNLIHEDGLMKTVTHLSKCYEILVKEFIVNLHENCGNKETEEYLKVFVRGKCINFSPIVINKFLERSNQAHPELEVSDNQMCKEITASQVKTWPFKGKLTVSKLSVKYDVLHRIGAANWVPTQHKSTISALLGKFIFAIGTKSKVDYGTYIFKQTLKHAGSYSVKGPIAFPSLICGIILKQFPNILTNKDFVCKRASPLIFHHKLFQGTHVHDVNKTSSGPSNESTIMSKTAMIALLRETCKELESKKLALERLISSLETSESAKSAYTDVAEQGEDDGGSDSEIEPEASPEDGTDNSVKFSSSESED